MKLLARTSTVVVLFTVPALAYSDFLQETKLVATDGVTGDALGQAIGAEGNTIILGAWGDDDFGSQSGAAYIFVREGGTWEQQAKLVAIDGAVGDRLGDAVALYGDTAVLAAPSDDDMGSLSGSVYVYVRGGSSWGLQDKFTAADGAANDQFGSAVVYDGTIIVAGSPYDDDAASDAGSAYIFQRIGGNWIQQAKVDASDASAFDHFGASLAVAGGTIVVGAPDDDTAGGTEAGSAYVFVRSGTVWVEQARLEPSDSGESHRFGHSVAIDGDRVIVGAPGDNDLGFGSGSAYLFSRSGTDWSEEAKLLPSDGANDDEFGFAVSLSGETAVVGSRSDDEGGTNSGSAYVFSSSEGKWSQQAKITAVDAQASDRFGEAVVVTPEFIAVGSPGDDHWGSDSGSAYIFREEPQPFGGAGCFGDISSPPCPCSNNSPLPAEGCLHSAGYGMKITAAGSTSLSADDLIMAAYQCPPENAGLFLSGSLPSSPTPLFDGFLCVGGDTRRYRALFQSIGVIADTGFVQQEPSGSYFVPGATYSFQYWSRDVSSPSPCGSNANFSPAFEVTMLP